MFSDSTLQRIPTSQLIKFGAVSATGNAVLRREIDEVEILSAKWANEFSIPVCGETHLLLSPPAEHNTGATVQPPQTYLDRIKSALSSLSRATWTSFCAVQSGSPQFLHSAGGDNISCLDGSNDSSSVQYMNASIVNMHFHANSEHTRAGDPHLLPMTACVCHRAHHCQAYLCACCMGTYTCSVARLSAEPVV